MIYSFDFGLNSELIKALKNRYNVTQQNTIIMNEKIKINNIKNINEIEKYLK